MIYIQWKLYFQLQLLFLYHFYFNFKLILRTGYANFDFNQCTIFTECCFQFWKRFEWSKSLPFWLLQRSFNLFPQWGDSPHPLTLFAKLWRCSSSLPSEGGKKAGPFKNKVDFSSKILFVTTVQGLFCVGFYLKSTFFASHGLFFSSCFYQL